MSCHYLHFVGVEIRIREYLLHNLGSGSATLPWKWIKIRPKAMEYVFTSIWSVSRALYSRIRIHIKLKSAIRISKKRLDPQHDMLYYFLGSLNFLWSRWNDCTQMIQNFWWEINTVVPKVKNSCEFLAWPIRKDVNKCLLQLCFLQRKLLGPSKNDKCLLHRMLTKEPVLRSIWQKSEIRRWPGRMWVLIARSWYIYYEDDILPYLLWSPWCTTIYRDHCYCDTAAGDCSLAWCTLRCSLYVSVY
jgi:hypothetical protein